MKRTLDEIRKQENKYTAELVGLKCKVNDRGYAIRIAEMRWNCIVYIVSGGK